MVAKSVSCRRRWFSKGGNVNHQPLPLPDFVIIGAMKAGTTTLFRWLGTHPRVLLPKAKEPGFYAETELWERGLSWYSALFPDLPPGFMTGEASTAYLTPDYAAVAARRLRETNPDVRLICMVRDPEERLRSHYRHEVQRNRERRPLSEAVSEAGSAYVGISCYTRLLEPWMDEFANGQLLVATLEELHGPGHPAWNQVLDHLGLPRVAPPGTAFNVTDRKPQYTRVMQQIYDSQWREPFGRLPRPLRGLLRPLLLRQGAAVRARYAESTAPLPDEVMAVLAAENVRLRAVLERESLPWEPAPPAGADHARDG
jgi:Sulfotransferase domain